MIIEIFWYPHFIGVPNLLGPTLKNSTKNLGHALNRSTDAIANHLPNAANAKGRYLNDVRTEGEGGGLVKT